MKPKNLIQKILIVDDEESIRFVFKKALEKKGFVVDLAADGAEAIKKFKEDDYLLAFMDIGLPDYDGLEILKEIKQERPNFPVIMVTAKSSMQNTIKAIQKGAFDYITKPFDLEEIYMAVDKILEMKSLKDRINILETELKEHFEVGEIIGKSRKIQEIYKTIGRIANRDVTVLIQGESGTGKELVARAVHFNSLRVTHPFIPVNCAAIPKDLLESELFGHEKGSFTGAESQRIGKFELADKGTIFLDEIGDMEFNLQAKILRVLEDRQVHRVGGKTPIKSDVRIIAATNCNLEEAVKEKKFREDLYHRLNVITIFLPPLRDRKDDIPLLCDYFLQKYSREFNKKTGRGDYRAVISLSALELLKNHNWPGNIRELENVIKRAMALCPDESILPEHLPPGIGGAGDGEKIFSYLNDTVKEKIKNELNNEILKNDIYDNVILNVEKELIGIVMAHTGNNQLKTAQLLGINRNTLRKKLQDTGEYDNEEE